MLLNCIFAGLFAAILAPFITKKSEKAAGILLPLAPLGIFIYLFSQLTSGGQILSETYEWIPNLGINFALQLDGLSHLFAMIITGIGTFIIIYAGGYLHGHKHLGRMYMYLLLFMTAMIGCAFSRNILLLFIFWELTSVCSYLLIGFNHEKEESQKAATQALLVTGSGGLALLAGLILLGHIGGSYHLSDLIVQAESIQSHALYPITLLLILAGAFTKSAQFPFHFWLPGAMAAPTPVSAYLHSATMVKLGIYLLARFSPVVGGTELFTTLLVCFGATTMFIGAFQSFQKKDLKQILAYSTVSVLGLLTFLIGIGSEMAIQAMIVFLLAHALSKGALFMVAGAVDHSAGTRDISVLSGLRKSMPIIFTAAVLAALSKTGIPPFFGFLGKELIYESVHLLGHEAHFLMGVTVLTKIILLCAIFRVALKPFLGKEATDLPKHPHKASFPLFIGPLTLSILGLVFGFLPKLIESNLLNPAISAVMQHTAHLHLKLWHGFNSVFVLSLVTIGFGIILYLWINPMIAIAKQFSRASCSQLYDLKLKWLYAFSTWQTKILQSGNLRYYILITLAGSLVIAGGPLMCLEPFANLEINWNNVPGLALGLCIILVIAAIASVFTRTFVSCIMAVGIVGFGIAVLFVFYGAPDLALTQLVIETLSVILVLSILHKLPEFKKIAKPSRELRDGILSIGVGGFITAFILLTQKYSIHETISDYFAKYSYLKAHGKNVVNVIIVDFRAFDTLGEITVLAIAGMGIWGLLKIKPGKKNA